MTVIVAGHLCADLTPALPGPPRVEPGTLTDIGPLGIALGGAVANTARALRAAGVDVSVAATTGNDALALVVDELLDREGFASDGVRPHPGASTSYSVVIESIGRDRAFWHHSGANDLFDGTHVDLAGADILHVGYPSLLAALAADGGTALAALFRRARQARITTSLDLAVVDPDGPAAAVSWDLLFDRVLPLTDVISPSIDDLRSVAPFAHTDWAAGDAAALARDLVDRGVAVAMVSAGPRGLVAASASADRLASGGLVLQRLRGWERASVEVAPETPARFVSANGAGDAATAGLLAGLVFGDSPRDAVSRAARSAASSIEGAFGLGRTHGPRALRIDAPDTPSTPDTVDTPDTTDTREHR